MHVFRDDIGTCTAPASYLARHLPVSRHATTLIGWFNTAETWSETRSAGRYDSLHAIFLREHLAPITRGRKSQLHPTNGSVSSRRRLITYNYINMPRIIAFSSTKPHYNTMMFSLSVFPCRVISSMNECEYPFILISDIKIFFRDFCQTRSFGLHAQREWESTVDEKKKMELLICNSWISHWFG